MCLIGLALAWSHHTRYHVGVVTRSVLAPMHRAKTREDRIARIPDFSLEIDRSCCTSKTKSQSPIPISNSNLNFQLQSPILIPNLNLLSRSPITICYLNPQSQYPILIPNSQSPNSNLLILIPNIKLLSQTESQSS